MGMVGPPFEGDKLGCRAVSYIKKKQLVKRIDHPNTGGFSPRLAKLGHHRRKIVRKRPFLRKMAAQMVQKHLLVQ